MASATTWIALLRAVNVAGTGKLPMKALAALFTAAGCKEARTYIASGNVLFRADAKLAAQVPARLGDAVERDFGFRPAIVMRSAAELAAVARNNPFLRSGADEQRLYVHFLADRPAAADVAALDPRRSPPDELRVVGREVYLHLLNGAGKTKITNAWLEGKLKTAGTARNWRTVTTLVELSGG